MKTVVITGVSSGIGRATAEEFLKIGWAVVGSVRRTSDSEDLRSQFPERFIPWICDLSETTNIETLKTVLDQNKINQVDVLVNNAGVALAAPFAHQNFSEIQTSFNINVLAVMRLTQILIPYLIPKSGRVINISSVSGKSGTPFLATYCATKHAIEGFSESLRREMNLYGIKVIIVGPGSIKTPIWSKGFDQSKEIYFKTPFAESYRKFLDFGQSEEQNALPVSAVVDDIIKAATSPKPCLRYAPIPRKVRNWYLTQMLPRSLVDYLLCKALGLNKPG